MTDLRYRQEILAEFVDMVGAVFRNVDECATATVEPPQEGRRYVAGVDLAISGDHTVVSVLDVTDPAAPRQVALERWTGIPWQLQLDRIAQIAEAYRLDMLEVDRTGLGDMPFDELASRLPGRQVWGVAFNSANKQGMVQGLALALERGTLALLPDPVQVGELKAYEADRLPSGKFTYSAPSGQHDDCVSALMLAYDAASTEGWGVVDYG
jgi:phage FluMu gp28-like protein